MNLRKLNSLKLLILSLAFVLQIQASSVYADTPQNLPKITISADNMPIRDFFADIEKQCSYTFFYSSSVLEGLDNVSATVSDMPIDELLRDVFAGTGRSFEIIGNKIAIKLDKSAGAVQNTGTADDAAAQDKELQFRGIVKDEKGEPMAGVGVIIVGTLKGTISDADGSYSIMASPGQELQFSFLGYQDKLVKLGNSSKVDVAMESAAQALESVVVTALGIRRDEKSLGYAATKVDDQRFANSVTSNNWVGGLVGQVAGLSVDRSNSGPGGSMRVTLRGESSADLSNNGALFVIDGVPMYNTSTASSASNDGSSAYAIDYGDGTSDINPDDIESITVLKGPAATALYGSNAANGAIIISTKSHNSEQGSLSVSFSQNVAFETLLTSPDLQYEYGQGTTSDYYYYLRGGDETKGSGYHPIADYPGSTVSLESWGPRMDGTLYYQYYDDKRGIGGTYDERGNFIRQATPYINRGDWFKDYFKTGYSVVNSVALSGRIGRKSSLRVTMSDTRNDGMTPNTGNNRQFMSVKARSRVVDWFSVEASMNYRRQQCDNIPTSSGYGSTAIMYGMWCYAPNVNMDWVKNYWLDGQEGQAQDASLSGGKNNGYFLANECVNTQNRNRVYGNLKFDFNIYKGLTLMVRAGIDTNQDFRTQRNATSTQANPEGWYREQSIGSVQFTGDFLLKYDTKIGNDFNLVANLGGSILNQSYRRNSQIADKLKLPAVYSLSNSLGEIKVDNYSYQRQTNSLYALLQLSWRNALFLDLTGRNDWSSTLPSGNNSYFYPSVSASAVINELFDFGRGGIVDLMKIRGSFAQVGHDTAPYRVEGYLYGTKFPGNVTVPTTKTNTNLMPEIVTSWEVGMDLRLFRNRLSIDAAYYDGTSKNLISKMPVSYSSGVSDIYTNAGTIRNWGVELTVSGTLIKTNGIQWKVGANWSMNRNKVLELGKGIDSWVVARYSSHATMVAYEGGSLTSMYGKGYKRAPEGSYAIDANGMMQDVSGKIVLDKTGKPLTDEDMQYIGECSPKWQGGFNTSFEYKGLKMSISFDGKFGGNVYSYTNWVLNYRGKGVNTLAGREGGMAPDGVILLSDGNYKINDVAIPKSDISEYYHSAYSNTNCEANFVSTSFLKLREVRVEYAFPKRLLAKTKVIQGLTFAVFGNNLACWSKFPGWDPEGLSMRGSSIVPGFELLQMPSGAQFGASWKITF